MKVSKDDTLVRKLSRLRDKMKENRWKVFNCLMFAIVGATIASFVVAIVFEPVRKILNPFQNLIMAFATATMAIFAALQWGVNKKLTDLQWSVRHPQPFVLDSSAYALEPRESRGPTPMCPDYPLYVLWVPLHVLNNGDIPINLKRLEIIDQRLGELLLDKDVSLEGKVIPAREHNTISCCFEMKPEITPGDLSRFKGQPVSLRLTFNSRGSNSKDFKATFLGVLS